VRAVLLACMVQRRAWVLLKAVPDPRLQGQEATFDPLDTVKVEAQDKLMCVAGAGHGACKGGKRQTAAAAHPLRPCQLEAGALGQRLAAL
jgi:hypothetical protein